MLLVAWLRSGDGSNNTRNRDAWGYETPHRHVLEGHRDRREGGTHAGRKARSPSRLRSGRRFSGSDGCNGISGTYELKGDIVRFSAGISTQKACIDIGTFDAAFRGALKGATRLTITADRLELFDAAAKRLAIFTGRAQSVRN
jgi:heat shock protein HslJ